MPELRRIYWEIAHKVSLEFSNFSYEFDVNDLNRRIDKILLEIKEKYGIANMPSINISKDVDLVNMTDDAVRFIISDENSAINDNKFVNSSYIISCKIAKVMKKGTNKNYSIELVTNDVKKIYSLIIDAMLDTHMFYLYGWNNEYGNLEKKKEFSKLKVSFCKKHKLTSVLDEYIDYDNYCSFATFCRNDDYSLDIEKFVQLWKKFSSELLSNLNHKDKESIVEDICKNYKHGAISKRKLKNMMKDLPMGKYSFIRISRKVPNFHAKKMESLFNGSIKIGNMIIIDTIKKYNYKRYFDAKYIDITDFII
ncbi:MAG: hypothetical protein K2K85_03795 [Clostridia bacterium]|nr:hypothetical protein [Clostridia bacterium]